MFGKQLDLSELGVRIRSARLNLGFSQDDIAQPTYTAAYISHVEHGKRRPSHEALTHIAGKLGMSLEQLVSGRDPDEDLRLEVAIQVAVADIHSGKAEEALACLEEVRMRAAETGHGRALESAAIAAAAALHRLGRTEEALGRFEGALEILTEASASRRTTAVVGKARCLLHLDEAKRAIHVLEAHLRELEREGEPNPSCLVETYAALIPGYFETGMVEAAKDVAAKGWELAPNIPDLERRACLYVNRAQLLLTQGEPREALASLALAEDLYRHLDWQSEGVKVALARSFVLTDQERLDEAKALIDQVLGENVSAVDRVDRVTALTRLAYIYRRKGDAQIGLATAEQAVQLAGEGFKESAAEARREAGMAAMALGEAGRALDYWRAALKDFTETGDKAESAKTARLIGDLLIEQGDLEGATEVFRRGLNAVGELR